MRPKQLNPGRYARPQMTGPGRLMLLRRLLFGPCPQTAIPDPVNRADIRNLEIRGLVEWCDINNRGVAQAVRLVHGKWWEAYEWTERWADEGPAHEHRGLSFWDPERLGNLTNPSHGK